MLSAARALGFRWLTPAAILGAIDGAFLQGVAAILGAIGALGPVVLAILVYRKGQRDAHEKSAAKSSSEADAWRQLAELQERRIRELEESHG